MSFPDSEPRANILIAYPYWNDEAAKQATTAIDHLRLVIDSGAFTAWKAGKPIALDDYCRFLEELPITPWRYFTLDVVGDAKGTLANYETMLKRGFKPVPIFTRGEDPSVLEDYYKTSDLVGVGGLVGTQKNKGFVNGIMKRIGTRRVHWLGFTNIDYLKHYRPYMCDSSGWNQAPYGAIRVYMGGGRTAYVKQRLCRNGPPADDVCDRIRQFGEDPYALAKRTAWNQISYRVSISSAVASSLDVQKHVATLLFNAVNSGGELGLFLSAFSQLKKRNAV